MPYQIIKSILCLLLVTTMHITHAMEHEDTHSSWTHKTLAQLSLKEKIGQLFMVAAISDTQQNPGFLEHTPYTMDSAYIKHLITDYHVGGVIFLGLSTIHKQYQLTQEFQQLSTIPLLIGQDLEWGLHMRLRDAIQFPYALTLGALQDNNLIYELGKEIGRQCKKIGVHINFAPVADINTNPDNPVINHRSFGDNPEAVSKKAQLFAQGLCDAGILACAKHFPGHGDTETDSHYALPIISHSQERLKNIELQPFKHLIANNIPALMTAHIALPALEKTDNVPASLSHNIVTRLLKEKLGFHGLVITDGLGMQGVTKNRKPGEVELAALLAGNDILLCPVDVPCAVEMIINAIKRGKVSQEEINRRVLKILSAKERTYTQPNTHFTLHPQHAYDLKKRIYEQAITIVRNTRRNIPLDPEQPCGILQIGYSEEQPFAQELCKTISVTTHISPNDPVIIAIHNMSRLAQEQYSITQETIECVNEIYISNRNIIVVLFGNPYSAAFFKHIPGVICAYQDDYDAQIAAADIVLGRLKAKGTLPVSLTGRSC